MPDAHTGRHRSELNSITLDNGRVILFRAIDTEMEPYVESWVVTLRKES